MLAAACCNETKALDDVANILKRHYKTNSSGGDAVCFACIEPCTQQLLMGRWDASGSSVAALPIAGELNTLILDWTACMEASKALLHRTVDTVQVAKWTDTDRRAWWSERAASDALIESLLSKLEALLGPLKCLLSGSRSVSPHGSTSTSTTGESSGVLHSDSGCDTINILCKNSETDEMSSKMEDEYLLNALNSLKVTELRQQLKESKLSVIGKKSELISRIQEYKSKNKIRSLDVCLYEDPQNVIVRSVSRPVSSVTSCGGVECQAVGSKVGRKVYVKTKSKEMKGADVDVQVKNTESSGASLNGFDDSTPGHMVLILDETLQQIPWEVLPCLRGKTCSRMPSFALLLHVLTRYQPSRTAADSSDIQPSNTRALSESCHADLGHSTEESDAVHTSNLQHTWYVLDPEGNLPATRATMSAFLQPYIDRYNWSGYIGEIPSEVAARYALNCFHVLKSHTGWQ